jgi:hypothetical protein
VEQRNTSGIPPAPTRRSSPDDSVGRMRDCLTARRNVDLTFARTRPAPCPWIFAATPAHDRHMLELLILIGRALALALRGHQELVLENLALRQQLTTGHARPSAHASRRGTSCLGSPWGESGGTGARRWCSSSPTPSCAGIATGSGDDGADVRDTDRMAVPHRSADPHARPRWRLQTRCGEHREFMASCACLVSTFRTHRIPSARTAPTSAVADLESVAESVHRTPDRLDPTPVSRSRDHLQRGASPAQSWEHPPGALSRFPKSVVSITAMSGAQRKASAAVQGQTPLVIYRLCEE